MVARSTANTAPHIRHKSGGATRTMYCCCFKTGNVILLKNNASITRPPFGRAPLTPLPRNARDFRLVFCPYFCCPCPYLHAWVVFHRLQGYLSCVFIRLSLVCFYYLCFLFFLSIATMSFVGYFLVRSLPSAFPAYLRTFICFDLIWFRLSCVHGWIRSGSVNVR